LPELPEVEAWRQQLDPLVERSPVERAGPAHIATLKTFDPPLRDLEGKTLHVERRAKRFLLPTGDGELVLMVHLMSAGRLKYVASGAKGAKTPMFRLQHGRRYRLRMRNASDDIHPIHLHRHIFELTNVAGRATSGVMKDVVMLGGYQTMEVDFTANSPGLSLFHCHMQLHMDYGFMALFDCR
jgi:FtsP/CotA-like multicopper oxidase with cupredoxin domain